MAAVFQPVKALISVEQYYRMAEAGVFEPDARIELIDGELYEMAPIGVRHLQAVNRLNRLLVLAYADHAVVSVRNPVVLRPRSVPQPDLAVLRPEANERGHPVPEPPDTWLVVEVADSSLSWDRIVKFRLYARGGVPVAWLVDVAAERVEVYERPGSEGFERRCAVEAGGVLELPGLPGRTIEVSAIFG